MQKVSGVMNTDFLSMQGSTTVTEAIHAMRPNNAHALLVDKRTDEDELGIVLISDIAKKVLAVNRSPDRVNIYEIMTKPVLSVDPDMKISYCARLFEHFGISTAPVVKNGQVLGIVSYDALVLKGLAADL
jgi:predicted transcriptional regulator